MTSYKIVVLGTGSVGKSALTVRLVSNHFVSLYDPTVEESYRSQVTIDNLPAVLEIIDTAGQEEYNALKDAHILKGMGFLLVYSITMRESFDALADIRARIFRIKEKDIDTDRIPIVVAGNKCDLENERHVTKLEGETRAQNWRCRFLETSALSKINVELAFYEVVRYIREEESKKVALTGNHQGFRFHLPGGGKCSIL